MAEIQPPDGDESFLRCPSGEGGWPQARRKRSPPLQPSWGIEGNRLACHPERSLAGSKAQSKDLYIPICTCLPTCSQNLKILRLRFAYGSTPLRMTTWCVARGSRNCSGEHCSPSERTGNRNSKQSVCRENRSGEHCSPRRVGAAACISRRDDLLIARISVGAASRLPPLTPRRRVPPARRAARSF